MNESNQCLRIPLRGDSSAFIDIIFLVHFSVSRRHPIRVLLGYATLRIKHIGVSPLARLLGGATCVLVKNIRVFKY